MYASALKALTATLIRVSAFIKHTPDWNCLPLVRFIAAQYPGCKVSWIELIALVLGSFSA
jgi:hypothetical protein